MCCNIPAAHAHIVYISQWIRYSRDCGSYHDFRDKWLQQTRKLLNKGFLVAKLKCKFYARHDMVNSDTLSELQMTPDMFRLS
jgi:hypothetical protein